MTAQALEDAAAEVAAEAGTPHQQRVVSAAFWAGAEAALQIAKQPGGVDELRRQIVEHGRLLGARRAA